jgi:Probable sensor domain DACNV
MALRMFDANHEWIARIHTQLQRYAVVQQHLPARSESYEVPTRWMLSQLMEVACWASLTANEGRPTRVRIALLASGSATTNQASLSRY